MANAEHLEILKSGVEKWNEWRIESRSVPDLEGADLKGIKLNGINLRRARLSGAYLYGAEMTDADLVYADFYSANLTLIDFTGANLHCSNLSGTNLFQTKLTNANLRGASLGGALFFGNDLNGANLKGASLIHTNLIAPDLYGTNLEKAKIGFTTFGLTDLSDCVGLDSVVVKHPCTIDFQTLRASKNLPKSFLLKIGLPELYIDYLPEFYSDALNFYPAFLSHSWANKDFARKLYEALIAKGVNVFFDEKKMKPGDDIYESISKGISLYDKMILVCSKESLSESWWVDRELDRILKKERDLFKERGQRINLLVPIAIDDFIFSWNGAKAEEVRRYFIGDFKDWQDEAKFEKALNDLIHALNADRPEVKPKSLL